MLLDAEADDDDCDCGGSAVDDDCEPAATAGGSVGRSDVLPLLAISASTIWTILSLLDGEYGSSSASDGDAELAVTVASVLYAGTDAVLSDGDAVLSDGAAVLSDGAAGGGFNGASVGSV